MGTFSLWHWIILFVCIALPAVLIKVLIGILRSDPRPILRRLAIALIALGAVFGITANIFSERFSTIGSPGAFMLGGAIGGGAIGLVVAVVVALCMRKRPSHLPPDHINSIASGPPPHGSYFYRHWRGQLSLPVSYWINCSVISMVLVVSVLAVYSQLDFSESYRFSAVAIILVWLVVSTVPVWQIVGAWRSASRYSLEHPTRYWGGVAKFMLVIGALGNLSTFATSGVPQIAEYWRIASGSDPFGTYTLRVLRDSTEFEISGSLGFGISKAVSDQLALYPGVRILHLNSLGGRISEARNLAKIIQQKGLSTYTATGCYSACVMPFAAGTERLIARQAQLGFHQYAFPGLDQSAFAQEYATDKAYLLSRGIESTFVDRVFETSSDSFWTPTYEELLRARFVTGRPRDEDVAVSGGGAPSNPQKFESDLLQIPLYAALKVAAPQQYQAILNVLLTAMQRGRSMAEVRAEAFPVIQKVIEERLPKASDNAVLMFTSVVAKQLQHLRRVDPVGCYDLAFGGNTNRPNLTPDLEKEELAASAAVIRSYAATVEIPSDDAVQASLQEVMRPLVNKFGDAMSLFDKQVLNDSEKIQLCQITVDMYAEISRLPRSQAIALLRNMFSR